MCRVASLAFLHKFSVQCAVVCSSCQSIADASHDCFELPTFEAPRYLLCRPLQAGTTFVAVLEGGGSAVAPGGGSGGGGGGGGGGGNGDAYGSASTPANGAVGGARRAESTVTGADLQNGKKRMWSRVGPGARRREYEEV